MKALTKKKGKLSLVMSFDLGTTDPETANKRISVVEGAIPWNTLKRQGIIYEIGEIYEDDIRLP